MIKYGNNVELNRIGQYFKGKKIEDGAEMLEVYDNFNIEIMENGNKIGINAIADIKEKGFYFDILAVYRNGKIYRGKRYHRKYIVTVRDVIFEYYKAENKVPWIGGK
jgi:hypothetical protein